MSNNTTIISDRVQAAAESFLLRKGYEVIQTGFESDLADGRIAIIARDTDCDEIVFVDVSSCCLEDKDSFAAPTLERWQIELLAASWLAEHDVPANTAFRLDAISIMIVGASRAVLRHHRGAFGFPEA